MDEFISRLSYAVINPLILLLFSIALVLFLWGVFQYVKSSDNPEARKKGTQHIIWGLVGLVIMFSAYAIIDIALGTFGL